MRKNPDGFVRYGVYFTPAPGPFADFGARWLGWDLAAGCHRAHPRVAGLPAPIADLTQTPRKYGFHATLKPPFRLADGCDAAALVQETEALAEHLSPISTKGLILTRLRGFLALMPEGKSQALGHLADAVVRGLDRFRANPTEADLAKRRALGLTKRQEAMLARWGYPFAGEEFRFHMTLTGSLDPDAATAAMNALEPILGPVLPEPVKISHLALVESDEAGFFHQIARLPLGR